MIINFSWIIAQKLAGFGVVGQIETEDCVALREQGIGAVVSLTESPMPRAAAGGLKYLHIPVVDMSPPSLDDIGRFVRFVLPRENTGVGVHCHAGLGRTGTMLACYLVHTGFEPLDAIAEIRRLRPGSIETEEQAQAVLNYARQLRGQANGSMGAAD